MQELEKNVLDVLLQRLLQRELITQTIFENARRSLHESVYEPPLFYYAEKERREEIHGYTRNPC